MKRHIKKVGVLGSGVMGMGISAHLAGAGLEVVMLDIVPPELSDEDQKKGITRDNPEFRNRFAAGSLARALKQNPQTGPFFHKDDAELITVGNFEDHAHLLKDCDFEEFAKAIRTVVAGRTYLSRGLGERIGSGRAVRRGGRAAPKTEPLTEREREVLQLLAEGKTAKQIAAVLGVSAKTVETHRQHIMTKLKIDNVAGLTKYAVRQGLTSLDE